MYISVQGYERTTGLTGTLGGLAMNCILPDSYPGIEFDENGVCNYCLKHEKGQPRGAKELRKLVESIPKGKGNYDCVVGTSGGRDSAYVLYCCAADSHRLPQCVGRTSHARYAGLRAAVHYDVTHTVTVQASRKGGHKQSLDV